MRIAGGLCRSSVIGHSKTVNKDLRSQPMFGGARSVTLGALLGASLLAFQTPASAGDFSLDWTTLNYPAGSLGPVDFTLTDEFGFELTARLQFTRIGGVSAIVTNPDDLVTGGGNTLGTQESIHLYWDANNQAGSRGESTYTSTLSILSGGTPFAVNGLTTIVSDIDSVDNNSTADRCDFVTFTGSAGDPTLTYIQTNPALRSVIIGPGTGSGATGPIAANEAQCIFNTAAGTGSPTSNGDDNGSIRATWPNGTTSATIIYDDSIEEVYAFAGMNPAARGIGIWAATVANVNQTVSLAKTTSSPAYSAAGQTLTYSYEVTNNGPLPITTSQNIVIDDDQIGQFTCGTIPPAGIPAGGSITCSANYTTTAGDALASGVTNVAVAGVGSVGQTFATRLQSNSDTVTIPRDLSAPSFTVNKVADRASVTTAGETITYTITVDNTGGQELTGITFSDVISQGTTGLALTTGPALSGDADGDGNLDITETWVYTATYDVTSANINDGDDIVNTFTFDTAQTPAQSSSATTSTPGPTFTCAGDNFASSNLISGVTGSTTCNNVGATGEPGEPALGNTGTLNSIWYSWTAPISGPVEFNTCSGNSNYDTYLSAFTGSSVGALTTVATNDDGAGCPGFSSRINFTATAGTTYRIQVDGYLGNTGTFQLDWFMTTPAADVSKTVDMANVSGTDTLTYTIIADNTGTVDLNGCSITDTLTQNGSGRTLAAGPTLVSGDANSNGIMETTETWVYTATYDVQQSDIEDGNDLLNSASFDCNETTPVTADATTTITQTPSLSIQKVASAPGFTTGNIVNAPAGTVITYSYVVTNNGNITIDNISVADVHDGVAADPVPGNETLTTDNGTVGDSPDSSTTGPADGIWDTLAPGDEVTFTATYVVQQGDIDTLQ